MWNEVAESGEYQLDCGVMDVGEGLWIQRCDRIILGTTQSRDYKVPSQLLADVTDLLWRASHAAANIIQTQRREPRKQYDKGRNSERYARRTDKGILKDAFDRELIVLFMWAIISQLNKQAYQGHSIAATGINQIITSLLTIKHGIIPPTMNLETPALNAIWITFRIKPSKRR